MRITYLNNSGFAIEKDRALYVIDCFDTKAHPMLRDLSRYAGVTFLASHAHRDHYDPEIHNLAKGRGVCVTAFDIPIKQGALSLSPGESAEAAGVRVRAFGSTDEGISFLLTFADGVSLFHAGDLNNWHWQDEGGEDYAANAETAYLKELGAIVRAVPAGSLFAAFFPVDPRMGTAYWRGAMQFAKALRPKVLIPMHFGEAFHPPEAFFAETAPYVGKIARPAQRDSVVDLE